MAGTSRDARRAETSQKILHAAQQEFAQHGFDGTTIRGIAGRAGVHASLVMQHFGSKAQLFANAVQLPADDTAAAADHLADVLSMRLGELPPETRALVRSMLTVPEAAESMRAFLDERVENLAKSFEGDDADVRATLAVSSILGLTIARHFVKLHAFERVDIDTLIEAANGLLSPDPNA